MTESPMPNAVSYNVPNNKYYFLEIQKAFGTIQEAGLHIHWRHYDYNLERKAAEKNQTLVIVTEKEQILSLKHLQSGFFLLLLGLFVSFIVFCGEHLWYFIVLRKKTQIKFLI